mgnify:CR=1 FL=1
MNRRSPMLRLRRQTSTASLKHFGPQLKTPFHWWSPSTNVDGLIEAACKVRVRLRASTCLRRQTSTASLKPIVRSWSAVWKKASPSTNVDGLIEATCSPSQARAKKAGLRRQTSTASLKPRRHGWRQAAIACLRRQTSTASLKPVDKLAVLAQSTLSPSTNVDGLIEALI